jgi:ABC-type ATPase involved in cell division
MDLANDFIHLQVVKKKDQVQLDGDNAGSERLDIHTLFEHLERNFVFVEGASGSGKSTLCKYICQQWARGAEGSFQSLC